MADENTGNHGGDIHWSFWLIVGVTLLFNMMGVTNFIIQMDAATVASMPEVHRIIIENRPDWITAGFALAVFGGELGCLLLLFKQPVAFYLFIVSLVGALVTMAYTLGIGGSAHGSGIGPAEHIVGNLIQLIVTAFLIWYTLWVKRKGWIGRK